MSPHRATPSRTALRSLLQGAIWLAAAFCGALCVARPLAAGVAPTLALAAVGGFVLTLGSVGMLRNARALRTGDAGRAWVPLRDVAFSAAFSLVCAVGLTLSASF